MEKKYIFPIAITLIAGILLIINLFENVKTDRRPSPGSKAPVFEVINIISNKKIVSAGLKGKVTFINFWASWCKPCRDEIPSMNNLNRVMSGNDIFQMVSIAYKEDPKKSSDYLKKNGFDIPVYFDPFGNASEKFGITGVPETYIVNKKGTIVKVSIGPEDWSSKTNINLIWSLLLTPQ